MAEPLPYVIPFISVSAAPVSGQSAYTLWLEGIKSALAPHALRSVKSSQHLSLYLSTPRPPNEHAW